MSLRASTPYAHVIASEFTSAAISAERINVIANERSERGNLKHGADKVAVPFSCRGLPRSRCSLAMTSKPLLLPVIASGVAARQSHARETNVSIIVSVQHTYVNYIYNF